MPLPKWYESSSHRRGRQLDTSPSPKALGRAVMGALKKPTQNSMGRETEAKAYQTNNEQVHVGWGPVAKCGR